MGIHGKLLGPCFATATKGKVQNVFFVCHRLGAWEPELVVMTRAREVRGVVFHTTRCTQCYGKRGTTGDRRRYDVSPEQTVAVGGCTNPTRRQRIPQTATMDIIHPPRRLRLPQKAQPIREPFLSVQVETLSARFRRP